MVQSRSGLMLGGLACTSSDENNSRPPAGAGGRHTAAVLGQRRATVFATNGPERIAGGFEVVTSLEHSMSDGFAVKAVTDRLPR